MSRNKKKSTGCYILSLLLGFVIFNVLWYIAVICIDLKALPSPIEVYKSYDQAIANGIVSHIGASLWRVMAGIVISLIIALFLGIIMGYYPKVNRLFSPLLYFSYPLPKLAFLPVIMILFGIGDTSKILVIVLIIALQLTISIRDAIRNIPSEDYDVLTSLRASPIQKIYHITLPAILPEMFSSLRIAVGIAMSALFFTETFGTDKGLGFYITDSWMRIDYLQMYFGILTLSLLGLGIFLIIDIIDQLVNKWK